MRLVCWNVNGLRTLKGYQPWFQLRNWEACVEELHADMLCIQEVKMTRKQLTQDLCVMDQFDAYYDLHPSKGYAGTARYVCLSPLRLGSRDTLAAPSDRLFASCLRRWMRRC